MSIKWFSINGVTQRYDYNALDNKPTIPSGGGDGLTDDVKQALLQLAQKVAYIDAQGQTYYQDLYDALYSAALTSITAAYTQSGTVYNTDSLDSLRPDIVVTAHYDDNTSEVVTNYTLSGTLTVGTSVITASYQGKTDTINVTVTRAAGTYSIANNLTGCTNSNSAATVAENAAYNATITANTGYTLTGATVNITMGGTALTGVYQNGTISIPNVTGDVVITVTAVAVTVSSISAVFNQGTATIYDTDSLDTLKQYLVVTATYSDSSTVTVPSADYTLSGTLTAGTSTITVSYSGKTTTFNVTVTHYVQSYVTDGLVAKFDAIDNTGNGHDASATTWKDLVGSYDITVPSGKATWDSDALVLDGSQGNNIYPLTAWPTSATRTVEVVLMPDAVSGSVMVANTGKEGNGRCIYFVKDTNIGVFNANTKPYINPEDSFTAIRQISISYSGNYTVSNVYVNGQSVTEQAQDNNTFSNSSRNLVIGAQGHSGNYAFIGKIYAIRIYDRVLTAEEVAQNLAVDVDKYGLVM